MLLNWCIYHDSRIARFLVLSVVEGAPEVSAEFGSQNLEIDKKRPVG